MLLTAPLQSRLRKMGVAAQKRRAGELLHFDHEAVEAAVEM
jgi:hypothetical protein